MKNKKLVFITFLVLVTAFISFTYFFKTNEKNKVENFAKNNKTMLARQDSISFGNNKNNVVIVEFMDPQCEACKAFYPAVKKVFHTYKDEVKLVYRYMANHKDSKFIIKILEASRKQNKYEEALDIIFSTQEKWSYENKELIWGFLSNSSINLEKLKKDFSNINIDKMLSQGFSDAKALDVRGTPTIFVNEKRLENLSYQKLLDLVESEIYK